jgi:hypothetical protein
MRIAKRKRQCTRDDESDSEAASDASEASIALEVGQVPCEDGM